MLPAFAFAFVSASAPVPALAFVVASDLSRDSGVEHLGTEEAALGPLNDLLVHRAVGVVHNDSALLEVDLSVEPRVPDQVDDPLLALVHVEPQLRAQALQVDPGVDLAVRLEEEVARGVDKGVAGGHEEEVGPQHLLGAGELPLRLLKVEVDVQRADKVGHGIAILVRLLLDDAHNVLELLLVHARVADAAPSGDDGRRQIPQDPGARCLDGVDVVGREEELEDLVARALEVKEGEEGPVDEPRALVQLAERVERLAVDLFLDLGDLLHGGLPVGSQDLRGQLSPRRGGDLVVIGRKHTELVKQLGGSAVVTAAVLEVAKVVEGVNHVDSDLYKSKPVSTAQRYLLEGATPERKR